jgi:hypothetical protein
MYAILPDPLGYLYRLPFKAEILHDMRRINRCVKGKWEEQEHKTGRTLYWEDQNNSKQTPFPAVCNALMTQN